MRALLRPRAVPETAEIEIAGAPVTVTVRCNPRAKRYRLTVTARGEPVLTFPDRGRWSEAEAFLSRNRGWLEKRLTRYPDAPGLAPGAVFPLRGVEHLLVATGGARGHVHQVGGADGPQVHVPGAPEHLRRRLVDWLKAEARSDLDFACSRHAATLGVTIAALRLRDQSTRWGSCSSARALNFNWRLVLAPPFVLDYVAAHEVAHLLEMNHSPAFWAQVARALPDYRTGRSWLRTHGSALMRY